VSAIVMKEQATASIALCLICTEADEEDGLSDRQHMT
jgi:hypothetical protein